MSKISVVVTGRNDDYDGNFDERLAIALSKNMRFLPNADFIFVEWNPIPNKTMTCEKLKIIFEDKVRYFAVHPKYHSRYCTIDGFLEYPAKNVGVREALNDFVLCTNSDVILSPEVADRMKGSLEKGKVYRAARVDIDRNFVDVKFPIPDKYRLSENKGLTNAGGDFLLMDKNSWNFITGYCEEFPEQRIHKDAFIIDLLVNTHGFPWEDLGEITHWRHPSSWSQLFEKRPGIGNPNWNYHKSGYTKNKDTWGLTFAKRSFRNGITWLE